MLKKFVSFDSLSYYDKKNKDRLGSILLDMVYPIGAIYLSTISTPPSTLFGGTWQQIKDRFLLAAGDTYNASTSGGESAHVLSVEEMPSHRHPVITGSHPVKEGETAWDRSKWGFSDHKLDPESLVAEGKLRYVESVGFEGASKEHNNMPPYITVYVWKRIK